MIMTMRGWIDDALRQAKESAFDLQPWPDYFEFKAEELKTILDYYEFSDADSILEIGCGNGFTSYLLSKKAGRVEALDLPDMDPSSHSIGIFTAEKLAENMRVDNMGVAGGSVMDMPYKSGSFDVVFSQYMLQYVRDKRKALSEMRRVLADDGVMVTIVPNFTERILVPIIKCEYVAGRLLARLMSGPSEKLCGTASVAAGPSASRRTVEEDAVARAFSDYILLRPDGAYRSYIQEMLSHRPRAWKRLLEDNGFKVQSIFSTQMLPIGLFGILGLSATKYLSGKIHDLTRGLGGLPLLKYMGYSLGIVSVKRHGL